MKKLITDFKANKHLVQSRLRKVNSFKKEFQKNTKLKLIYGNGGNLLLMERNFLKWRVIGETGPWYLL